MDRTARIVISLCVAGLIANIWYVIKHPAPPPPVPAIAAAPAGAPSAGPAAAKVAQPTAGGVIAQPSATPALPEMKPLAESLSAQGAEFVFNNDAGGIEQVILLMHRGEHNGSVSLNRDRGMPIGSLGYNPGEVVGGFEMRTDKAKGEAFFTKTDPNGIEITKHFVLPSAGKTTPQYTVNLEISFHNPSQDPLMVPPFFVGTGGAAPIHERDQPMYTRFDWSQDGKATNIDVTWFSASSIPIIGYQTRPERQIYLESKPDVQWAAVSSQYFTTVLSAKARGISVWAKRYDTRKQNDSPVFGMQGALGLAGFTVAPGATVTKAFEVYSGPKDLSLLRSLGGNQEKVMNFGMFGIVSEFLLWAMNGLHGVLGNYAAAIIVLTLLIKSVLWPLQNKATNEMRKMSALAPKMTELKEKYKDDPQKMNEETMKLYRVYGVNPFSGCIPMLIQIPIFFGFYAMLGTAIELRNSSFLWIHDLSQPDTVGYLLGYPINLLPIVMAGTMVWQMTITPKSGDAMQQRIFYFMPVIFLMFSYNYASGLALYWTTQNLFSIGQLYLTRNRPLPTLVKKTVTTNRTSSTLKKKKKGTA